MPTFIVPFSKNSKVKNYTLSLFLFLLPGLSFAQSRLDTLVQEGIALHDAGRYAEAIATYEKGLKVAPNDPLLHYEIAYSHYAAQDHAAAIVHANKVLKQKDQYLKEAYLIKGSALDNQGKTKAALKTYAKGIKAFPDSYLLPYNAGLTNYRTQDYELAEMHLIKGIEINPDHSSSHYLLATLKAEQGERVPALLALYLFLFLEPDSERSADAWSLLTQLLHRGVSREDARTINISVEMLEDKNEFSALDLLIPLMIAGNSTEENADKTPEELFVENTQAIFSMLGNEEGKKGVWWEVYAPFFTSIDDAGHTEAFCYYLSQAKGEAVTTWLEANPEKLEAFGKWLQ